MPPPRRARPRQPWHAFGQAFSQIRHDFGDTQTDAAARLGVSAPYICQLERGISQPSLELVERILDEYDCRAREEELKRLAGRWHEPEETEEERMRRIIREELQHLSGAQVLTRELTRLQRAYPDEPLLLPRLEGGYDTLTPEEALLAAQDIEDEIKRRVARKRPSESAED